MKIYVTLAVALLISACARPDYGYVWPDRFGFSGGPQLGYAIKRVVEKQKPVTLVGDDGSVCRTSRDRFARTTRGRWIACVWKLPSLDSTELASN